MRKHWKIGIIILILASAIVIFSITMASKNDKPTSNTSPEIAQRRQRRIPPLFRKVMKEEGITPQDLRNNPQLQEKLREKVRKRRTERFPSVGPKQFSEEAAKPVEKKPPELTEPPKKREESKDGADYYKVIVEKNLFRPLGSGAEKKEPEFGLLGTVIAKSKDKVNKALIMDYRRNQAVYVAKGEKVGDATVEKIEPGHVVLLHQGEKKDFYLQEIQFIGAKGGSPRRGRPPQMKGAPGSEETRRRRMEEMKRREREKMERFKKLKKEEIEKMKRKMMEKQRRRGRRIRILRPDKE